MPIVGSNTPGPAGQIRASAEVQVGDADVNNVNLTAQTPGSLSGTVRFAFTNPATAASPNVNVNLGPPTSGPAFFGGPIPRAEWDSGHTSFQFSSVPPEQFRFYASVTGQGVYVKSATIRGQDVLNQPLTVNGVTGPIDVVVSDDVGNVDVTVNDSDGHPASGASVMLVMPSGARRTIISGDDGHATNQTIPVGEYRVWAFDDLSAVPFNEEDWMNQNAGPGERITVASGGSANVTVKRITAPAQ
jgi:hypothetical protein